MARKIPELIFMGTKPEADLPLAEVLPLCAQGNQAAQTRVIAFYWARVVRAVIKRNDLETAKENALEAFRKVFRHLSRQPIEKFENYLMRTATNTAKKRWKKEKKLATIKDDPKPGALDQAPDLVNTERTVAEVEEDRFREEVFALCAPMDRALFLAIDRADRTVEEMAKVTELGEEEVRRALDRVRARFHDADEKRKQQLDREGRRVGR